MAKSDFWLSIYSVMLRRGYEILRVAEGGVALISD